MQQFQIDSKKLLDLLTKSMKIIQAKSPIPMYYSGLFEVKNNILNITVSDMDHTLITNMQVNGDDTSFVIKMIDLFEIVKKISGIITIYKDYNKITIKCDKSHIELFLMEDEFVKISNDHIKYIITLSMEKFNKIFNFLPMCSDEWSFTFKLNNNQLESTGSDRKRLVFCKTSIECNLIESFSISYKTLQLLIKFINGNIEIYQKNSQLIFKFNNGILWTKLSNAPNINYQKILQKCNNVNKIIINKKDLLQALGRVGLLASNISKVVKLTFKENQLSLYASDASRGQAEELLILENYNINGCIFLNCEFLMNAIKTIESNNIILYYTGEISHFFITNEHEFLSITHVIMPIIMNN